MITHGAMPTWLILLIVFGTIGPMMRMIFGGGFQPYHKRKRFERGAADDVARLDSAIAERDTVIEDLQRRLGEMEERLDFTERLLSERSATGYTSAPEQAHSP
ncbi:MAG TPA: hypothetical protein VGQ69_12960 [Gemmatimonadales bacterium]|jgi:hypothetical protein|nr:hypothetical protein [Gemmatimonadales bacterium]